MSKAWPPKPTSNKNQRSVPDGIQKCSDHDKKISAPTAIAASLSVYDCLVLSVNDRRFNCFTAAQMIIEKRKTGDVWMEVEKAMPKIVAKTDDTTFPPDGPLKLDEVLLCNKLENMYTRCKIDARQPDIKVVHRKDHGKSTLSIIAREMSTNGLSWAGTDSTFKVEDHWIAQFSSKSKDPIVIAKQFLQHMLMRMTNPCELIKGFTYRAHRGGNRNEELDDLPAQVVSELFRLSVDLFKMNRWELESEEIEDLRNSAFFIGLGSSDGERMEVREKIRSFRLIYEGCLREKLKEAFCDVRRAEQDGDKLVNMSHEKVAKRKKTSSASTREGTPLSPGLVVEKNVVGGSNISLPAEHSKSVRFANGSESPNTDNSMEYADLDPVPYSDPVNPYLNNSGYYNYQ